MAPRFLLTPGPSNYNMTLMAKRGDWLKYEATPEQKRKIAKIGGDTTRDIHPPDHFSNLGKQSWAKAPKSREFMAEIGRKGGAAGRGSKKPHSAANLPKPGPRTETGQPPSLEASPSGAGSIAGPGVPDKNSAPGSDGQE